MSTPALARATAELMGGLPGLLPFIAEPFAHVIVSAALHDPDDPDWLARVIDDAALMRTGRSIGLLASVDVADVVRAAILGEA